MKRGARLVLVAVAAWSAGLREGRAVAGPLDQPIAEYRVKASTQADEDLVFTPPGFERPGTPARAEGPDDARLTLVVRDAEGGKPTPCRVNVVGSDGRFYQPVDPRLNTYSLTGVWPKTGKGNRPEKAPIRYFGRFFYSNGEAVVRVPPGVVRVEVWKGFEYTPQTRTVTLEKKEARTVAIDLVRGVGKAELGYRSGDPHLHFARLSDDDDRTILDLMEAEDIQYGTPLAYNEPAGPYTGAMESMDTPQRALGTPSIRGRGTYQILSGQEYRSATYGHMNLFLLNDLVLKGQSLNANDWPLYGEIARKAREAGGIAFHAHGGYAQEVYADVVQDRIDAVELLQFGVYRGMGLDDWYRMLNSGFRTPIVGACDYPACRKLGDCRTYVEADPSSPPDIAAWLRGAAAGRSFVTTGPLLLLEVDGRKPGGSISRQGPGPHRLAARVRVRSEVAPVTHVQLVVNGRVLAEKDVEPAEGLARWIELERPIELDRSAWVAARAFSTSKLGTPDAESHTNPVFVFLDGKAPYEQAALDVLVKRIDGQIAAHKKRKFAEQARVLSYFERSRDILLKIREAGGAPAAGHPSQLARGEPALDTGKRSHTDEELRAFLKPVPPRPIAEALRGFETVAGFRMELVASEPLVNSPVAAAFDEDGRLYVAEMRDYPYKPRPGREPLGSVRLLIDRDGDGRFDEGHVFADKLLWAAGIAPWKGGVFVAAPPDIWYLKDNDGDHRADVREQVFTGFGLQNQQAMLNNLQWGLDHKIYGATAGNGGSVRPGGRPDATPVSVDGRDFRFDPLTRSLEAVSGTVQFGNTFDDWGNRFLCSESQPLLHVVLPQQYLERNPFLPVARTIQNLATPPVPIFRISPIERWRQIRSSRRIAHNARLATAAGASHHVVDAAAGVTVYRGGAYPPQYYGSVFVGDAQNNLVHRRVLEPDGVTFTSRRGEEGTEFVRSPDIWFRPVNFVNAPDGTLYVLDMYREVLESIHIPNDVVKFLDLTSGRDRGRIYRIAPPGFQNPGPPQLSRATTEELVTALASPHGWYRDTAHRLLHERQDRTAVEPLRRLLFTSGDARARLHALWSLQGLGSLRDDDLARALDDASAAVRCHALQLAEPRLKSAPAILEKVLALDPSEPRLRFQLAFTLGAASDPRAVHALAKVARSAVADHWIRTAVLSSAGQSSAALLTELLRDPALVGRPEGVELLTSLASVVGARGKPGEIGALLAALADAPEVQAIQSPGQPLVLAVGEALKPSGARLDTALAEGPAAARALLEHLEAYSRRTAADTRSPDAARRRAVDFLACLSLARSRGTLEGLLDVRQSEPVQIAALRALAGYASPEVAPMVLDRWREYAPAVRAQAVETLLSRTDRALAYLEAAEQGRADLAPLDPARRARLLNHPSEAVRARARQVLGTSAATRQQVVDAYRAALQLSGDAGRGQAVFRRECSACHKLGGEGHAVGPDLTSSSARDAEALLVHVLDPNRYVLPNYTLYQVADVDGRIHHGLMLAQSSTSLTLGSEQGKTETILRAHVEQIAATGRSLMPEGFEARISKPEMADLLAFLLSNQTALASQSAPLDIGTEPGLIEPGR